MKGGPGEEEEPLQMAGGAHEEEEPLQMKGGPEEEEPAQMKSGLEEEEKPAQMAGKGGAEEELPAQGKFVIQKKKNDTGLPDSLKTGVENLSGMSMDHVKVHYNSPKPAQLNALAYAQGSDIHVAAGQERHLPHEAWHVVQQMQGRVQPTRQMKDSVPVNDDKGLEKEADEMGAKGLAMGQTLQKKQWGSPAINFRMKANGDKTIQRYMKIDDFFPLIKKYDNQKQHRLMHWNAVGKFDEYLENPKSAADKIQEWSEMSTSYGGGELAPGQTNKGETLPRYLEYFNDFMAALPLSMGVLRFKKGFDRLTDHGWISDNVELPPSRFNGKKVTVHVILAVKDTEANSESVTINPHVTVRLKSSQDKFDQIAMINDRETKSAEMKALGKEGSLNSLSIGTRTDRDKAESGASARVGIEMADLKAIFTQEWLAGIVSRDAWAAAATNSSGQKLTKKFIVDGASSTTEEVS